MHFRDVRVGKAFWLSCVQPTCFYEFVFCTLCRVCVLVRCHLTRDKLNPSHSSFSPPPRSPSRDSRFALHFPLQRDAQWSVLCWPLCIPSRPPVIWIDKAQCTNFEYQTILSAYYQIHNSIMILSCVFFPSRGLKQIVSFVSTPRKSRPPLGEGEEEVDSKVGKNWAGQKVARVNLLRARRAP